MTDRVRFITHQSKQVLLIDLSGCLGAEVEKIFRAVPDLVSTRPGGSVLILSDFTGASFEREAIQTMQQTAVFDKPYVKKSAWVGTENFPQGFAETSRISPAANFPLSRPAKKPWHGWWRTESTARKNSVSPVLTAEGAQPPITIPT
jgi:hypothetical protein